MSTFAQEIALWLESKTPAVEPRKCALDHDVPQCTPACSNPFAQLEAQGRPDHPDHRTPVQKADDQALTDSEGFPRGLYLG